MPRPEEIFVVEGFILRHTERALHVRINDEDIWIPKSQMHDVDELPQEGNAELRMSAWIAKEKGLR